MQKKTQNRPKYATRFLTLSERKATQKLNVAAAKSFSPVWMLLVQIASMNVFYSMWYLKDITFHEKSTWLWDFFERHVAAFFEASVLKEVRILCVISTITIPKFQNKADHASYFRN